MKYQESQILKPNFFIIGAAKSGTTAISEYLGNHPNVFFSNPKEPEFFATDFSNRVISTEKDYLRLFRDVNPLNHRAIGEGSVIYLYSRVAVQNILRFQPQARFIVMLRNPIEVVVSMHAQALVQGTENIPNFLDAWSAEEARKKGKNIPAGCRDVKLLYYSERGKLGTQLKRVVQYVPEDQLKVIVYDDFVENSRRVYLELLEFLELPDDGRTQFPRVNERRNVKSVFIQTSLALLMRWWLPIRTRLTLGRGFGLGKFIQKVNTKTLTYERKIIPEEIRIFLSSFYENEIMLLQEILGRDLSHWIVAGK